MLGKVWCLVLILVASFAICSQGAESTTDERLAQKVTISASRKSVLNILDELSKSSGITLKAGVTNKDWQVRDRKLNVFAKDVPLSSLMTSIARVSVCKWSVDKEKSPYTYRLVADKAAIAEAKARLDKRSQELTSLKRKFFNDISKFDQLAPAEQAKLRKDSPSLARFIDSESGKYCGRFLRECPKAAAMLIDGRSEILRASELPEPARQELMRTVQEQVKQQEASMSNLVQDVTVFSSTTVNGKPVMVQQNMPQPERKAPEVTEDKVNNGIIGINLDSYRVGLSSGYYGNMVASCADVCLAIGFTVDDKEINVSDAGEPIAEHADEAAIHEKVTLKLAQGQPTFSVFDEALANASGLAVVSDDFLPNTINGTLKLEGELKDVLDSFAGPNRYNWWKNGAMIELRSRDWYEKRLLQIPDADLERWEQSLDQKGYIDIDGLSEMAYYSQDQLNASIPVDNTVYKSGACGTVDGYRKFLSIYSTMSRDQKVQLFSKDGLDLTLLTPEQWAQVEKLVFSMDITMLNNPDLRLKGSVQRDIAGSGGLYNISLSSAAEHKSCGWCIPVPQKKSSETHQ